MLSQLVMTTRQMMAQSHFWHDFEHFPISQNRGHSEKSNDEISK